MKSSSREATLPLVVFFMFAVVVVSPRSPMLYSFGRDTRELLLDGYASRPEQVSEQVFLLKIAVRRGALRDQLYRIISNLCAAEPRERSRRNTGRSSEGVEG